jgi:hypothetical protein
MTTILCDISAYGELVVFWGGELRATLCEISAFVTELFGSRLFMFV